MKFNFKKVAAVTASMLATVGLTAGVASAMSYPDNWSSQNVAVVYGNDIDHGVASNINEDISDSISFSSGGASVGEESAMISGTGDDLTLGEALSAVDNKLDEGDLSELLAEGTLEDDSVDYSEEETVDYDQEIKLSNDGVEYKSLSDDDEYVVNTDASGDELPVLNIDQSSGKAYNITIDFNSKINATAYDDSESFTVAGTELTFDPDMSKGDGELILFESTETVSVGLGESITVGGDTVELTSVNSDASPTNIALKVNGETYSEVETGDTEAGYYVDSINVNTIGEEAASVELFAGTKEWKIDTLDNSAADVDIDSESVNGVQAYVDGSNDDATAISSITFAVDPSDLDADEKDYLEVGEELQDPLFGDLKMVFESVEPELKSEDKGKIEATGGDEFDLTFTSRNGNEYTISPMQYSSGNLIGGEDWYVNATYSIMKEDHIFIASEGTGTAEESIVYEVKNIDDGDSGDGDEKVEFVDLSSGSSEIVSQGDEIGDTGLYVQNNITDGADNFSLTDDSDADVSVNNELVSESGMSMNITKGATISGGADEDTVTINGVTYEYDDTGVLAGEGKNLSASNLESAGFTVEGSLGDLNITGYNVYSLGSGTGSITANNFTQVEFTEDRDDVINEDGEVTKGSIVANISVDPDTDDDVLDVIPSYPTGGWNKTSIAKDTDTEFALSEFGTYAESDSDESTYLDIWTPSSDQTKYNVAFSSTASSGDSGDAGSKVIMDDEAYSENDVVIAVGGSCINSAAAEALGVSEGTCGSDFTDETGVGSGEFLIQKVSDAYDGEATAVVVAGYSASDTEAAGETFTDEDIELSEDGEVYSTATKEVVTAE